MKTTDPTTVEVQKVTLRDVKIATWICFFAWTFAVYDFVLFGNLLPVLAAELGWAPADATNINTWITVGTALVAFGIGPIVDKIGRRKGIVLAVIGAAVASLLTAAAGWVAGVVGGVGIVLLILIRSIAGLGYSEQALNATYLSEMFAHAYNDPAKARRRGLIYSLVQSGWPIGSVIAALSIYLLMPIGGWALCFIVAFFPAIFIGFAARYLKESPQFVNRRNAHKLLAEGRVEEAEALAKAAGVEIRDEHAPLVSAFKGESLRATLVIGGAFLLSWLGILVFAILGTSILTAESGKGIEFSNALLILVISNATAFGGYVFHGWLGDKIGRRNTIAIGWFFSSISFAAMLLVPSASEVLVIAFYSLGLFFLIGPFAALLFFNGESFPVHTRATGGSIINAAGQLGAILGGVFLTAALASGQSWIDAALIWGCVPILLAAVLILFARNVDPRTVRAD
ncbi:MFS transporter [Paenarthrobacter sp. NPDC089675]|uniref:MFS transporter n=1 Tax=Paenarthrobacter sp. NPDC089675 TaxID=3364376 RepID=UPI003811C2C5